MQCPEFDTLSVAESLTHQQGCESCRTLCALRALDRPNPEECLQVEGLFGILDALSTPDKDMVHSHLEKCSACTVALLALSGESLANISTSAWKGPSMDTNLPSHHISTKLAVLGGLAFAVLAVLAVLLLRPVGGQDAIVAKASTDNRANDAALLPGASLPEPTAKARSEEEKRERLSVIVSLAALEENASKLESLCSEALAIDLKSKETSQVCSLAFGKGSTPGAPEQTVAAKDICDEVTCLVEPDLPCCEKYLKDEVGQGRTETISADNCDEVTCLVEPERACCEKYNSTSDDDKAKVKTLLNKLNSKIRNKQFGAASAMCKKALTIAPNNSQAHTSCAMVACNLKQFDKAEFHITKITSPERKAGVQQICNRLRPQPDTVEQLNKLGQSQMRNKQFGGAMLSCRKAIKMDPNNVDAHQVCAMAACNLKHFNVANRHLEKLSGPTKAAITQICWRLGAPQGENK